MNINLIRELQLFNSWVKKEIHKSANFSINYWAHQSCSNDVIEYQLWIEGIIQETSESLEDLVNELPRIKQLCLLKKEFSA